MSAYADDSRVVVVPGDVPLYAVTCPDGSVVRVRQEYTGEFLVWPDGVNELVGATIFSSADEAIRSLIGDPQ